MGPATRLVKSSRPVPDASGTASCFFHIFMPEVASEPDLMAQALSVPGVAEPLARKRPKSGERRVQILEALAAMPELPGLSMSPLPRWRLG